jgi:bifunctional N-acetylglucosamine-1-phosphate-uridyltransferase/glucosamine-1-phosphate-acetyltransferase GlmU-like protein
MTWRAVVAALDDGVAFRSRVSMYLHPLAGRPLLWHVLTSLLGTTPRPREVRVLHRADTAVSFADLPDIVRFEPVERGDESRALRAAVTPPGLTVLADGAAPLLTPSTFARLLRAAQSGVAMVAGEQEHLPGLTVAGEGPALASAEDPRHPEGSMRVAATSPAELLRVSDRHSLSDASLVVRDRLVQRHEAHGVTFILPATTWLDVDVRLGADTLIYPGVVLEGATVIGPECVIGPHSRVVDATIGRGAELSGWNYVARTQVRNHAVLEPYARRGVD